MHHNLHVPQRAAAKAPALVEQCGGVYCTDLVHDKHNDSVRGAKLQERGK